MSSEYAVELENIHKTFPGGVVANKGITLQIRKGEIIGLLGENGAGKSTLMNILYGLLKSDEGRIVINGEEVTLHSPEDAILRGVGMVHQHFKLIPPLTVTENVILGLEPLRGLGVGRGLLSRFRSLLPIGFKGAAKRIREIAEENGLDVDPDAKVEDLSVGLQQRVEIIKTLYRDAEILILDEPTSVLTPQEVEEMFVTLNKFREQGKTIILITHKLKEPMALCDRIAVLRDGELVGIVNTADTSPEQLAEMMVGRSVVFTLEKPPASPGDVVLSVRNLVVHDNRRLEKVRGISFDVSAGEIFGIAGVDGNGQAELVEALAGLRKPRHGEVFLDGLDITGVSARNVRSAGVSHIPEDRHKMGLVLSFSVEENFALGKHHTAPFAKGPGYFMLDLKAIHDTTVKLVDQFSIKVSSTTDAADTLSGGNQQKLVAARELASVPKLVIAAQPTRGLDVGATEYIRRVLIEMRDKGAAVLLISAELDEIRNLSDRIGVIFDGELVAIKHPDETDAQELGLLMAGHGHHRSEADSMEGALQ